MRVKKILSVGAAALALTVAGFATATPASSAEDLWVFDGENLTGGVDYWNWDDVNLAGDTFSTGASENDAISSVDSNWGDSITFYTDSWGGGDALGISSHEVRNSLGSYNNRISSLYFT
ncbi:hypothetical protein ACFFS2_18720 [Streptomyces aurantiacus]|nr:hypothetical protein [Streptomyces aurantiacus]